MRKIIPWVIIEACERDLRETDYEAKYINRLDEIISDHLEITLKADTDEWVTYINNLNL